MKKNKMVIVSHANEDRKACYGAQKRMIRVQKYWKDHVEK